MTVTSLCVAWALLAQQPGSVLKQGGETPRGDVSTPGPLVPIKSSRPRLNPPDLIAALLAPSQDEPLSGQPLPLVDALTKAGNRSRQFEAVRAYWSCAAAMAEYHACRLDHAQMKWLVDDRQKQEPNVTPASAADLAAIAAQLKEAELKAVSAQGDLADKAGIAAAQPLPLPADLPTVSKYRSLFAEFYANRQAPPRMRLLDRTMGLRPKALEMRTEAVQSAIDALEAVQEGYSQGHVGADSVVQCIWQLSKQRKAFIESVRAYNHEIAEYALTVAGEGASPAALTGMLIKTELTHTGTTGGTTFEAGRASTNSGPPRTFEPTPAGGSFEASPAAPRPLASILGSGDKAGDTTTASRDNKTWGPAGPSQPGPKFTPSERSSQLHTRYKLWDDEVLASYETAAATAPESSSYAGLMEMSGPKRTQRLVSLLHWDRRAHDSATAPIALESFLARNGGSQRRAMLGAYWAASEAAARQQCMADRVGALALLVPAVLKLRSAPGGGEAMVQLRAAQSGADADLQDSQIALWAAEHELTRVAGSPLENAWLRPSTAPHGGRYELRADAQSAQIAQTRAVQTLLIAVPALHASLQDRAEAIVREDAVRTAGAAAFQGGGKPFEAALHAVETQHEQTLAFLDTLTRYNLAIADYVLAVMSPQSLPEQLTNALVVKAR